MRVALGPVLESFAGLLQIERAENAG
jgi:hypothetical protein